MRQSQKNNRTRSRGRKPSNPLSRSYDSNGPDVKIRGTASHIAEKYQSLARDALASGDIVMAENYFQHAEHYLRIIAAAQASSREEGRAVNNNNSHANGEAPNGNDRPARKAAASNGDITGDEPQPEVGDMGSTAIEMDVAVIEEVAGAGEQPAVTSDAETEEAAAAPPRRRRRTTYRPRKRAGQDASEEAAPAPAAPAEPAPAAPAEE